MSPTLLLLAGLAVAASVLHGVQGHWTAPPFESCNTMRPTNDSAGQGHTAQPQSIPWPGRAIHTMGNGYTLGGQHTIRLQGPTFKGFMCRMMPAGSSLLNAYDAIGQFKLISSVSYTFPGPNCNNANGGGLGSSHSIRHIHSKRDAQSAEKYYNNLRITWHAPRNNEGPVELVCTIVQSMNHYWVGLRLTDPIYAVNDPRAPAPAPPTTQPPPPPPAGNPEAPRLVPAPQPDAVAKPQAPNPDASDSPSGTPASPAGNATGPPSNMSDASVAEASRKSAAGSPASRHHCPLVPLLISTAAVLLAASIL